MQPVISYYGLWKRRVEWISLPTVAYHHPFAGMQKLSIKKFKET
jgi:hypothetical protein